MAAQSLIRNARLEDVPALWSLVQDYTREIAPGGAQPQERATKRSLTALIAHQGGTVLVRDLDGMPAGMLAASIGRSPWSDVPVADYLIFYLAPTLRGGRAALLMLRAYEAWAIERGARVLGVSDTGTQLQRLLARQGYLPAERKFMKVL